MIIAKNYPLLKHNTFGLNVKADFFIQYENIKQLRDILSSTLLRDKKILHIGSGSNLLFTQDFHGVILHSDIRYIVPVSESDDTILIKAGSGVNWDYFCKTMAEKGLWGTENLSYIPGEVGASAVQNVGAYGVEACDIIESVETIELSTGEIRTFKQSECNYAYRDSIFKGELKDKYIITSVTYRLSKKIKPVLEYAGLKSFFNGEKIDNPMQIRNAIISIRKDKLPEPTEIGSAGSFFKNPVIDETKFNELKSTYQTMPYYALDNNLYKIPAAWLIEQCGWKGKKNGNAGVYEKQPLVLVNHGNATAKEIITLAENIKQSVNERFGICISPEVNYI